MGKQVTLELLKKEEIESRNQPTLVPRPQSLPGYFLTLPGYSEIINVA
jgi:hypothetical protein